MIFEVDVIVVVIEVMGVEVILVVLVMIVEDVDFGSVLERIFEVIWVEVILGVFVFGERMIFLVLMKEEGGLFLMIIWKFLC